MLTKLLTNGSVRKHKSCAVISSEQNDDLPKEIKDQIEERMSEIKNITVMLYIQYDKECKLDRKLKNLHEIWKMSDHDVEIVENIGRVKSGSLSDRICKYMNKTHGIDPHVQQGVGDEPRFSNGKRNKKYHKLSIFY